MNFRLYDQTNERYMSPNEVGWRFSDVVNGIYKTIKLQCGSGIYLKVKVLNIEGEEIEIDKEIFEGDRITLTTQNAEGRVGVVEFKDGMFSVEGFAVTKFMSEAFQFKFYE